MGRLMEARPETLRAAAAGLLRVRDREGVERPLQANAVQRAFERECGRQNIVLKARQMGITTWVAGRFFLKTITARGVMTVQVAQTREAAEGIFRVVQSCRRGRCAGVRRMRGRCVSRRWIVSFAW